MKLEKLAGATSEIWQVFIRDSSSTTGAGLAGLVFNTAGLTAYYHRDTDTTATAITLATMTVGTFTSSGFKEIDATNMPGWYQFCPPNAAIAAGAKSCGFHLKGATNMAPLPIEVQLTAYNPDDAVRMGMTALPNAAAEAAGGLYTRGTGAGQIKQTNNGEIDSNAVHWNNLATVALPLIPTVAGRTLDCSAGGEAGVDWANVGSPTTAVDLSGTTIKTTQKVDVDTIKTNPVVNGGTVTFASNTTVANTTGAVGSVTGAVGSVTGNVTGSVGSVVGAVGSVTGNVGGSVASVTGLTASDVGAIKTQTDKMTFTVANKMDSNLLAINGDATSAANIAKTTRAIGRGTATTAGSSTTLIATSAFLPVGVAANADQFAGRVVTFDADTVSTKLRGESTSISSSTAAAAPVFTVVALTVAPVDGDTFSVT